MDSQSPTDSTPCAAPSTPSSHPHRTARTSRATLPAPDAHHPHTPSRTASAIPDISPKTADPSQYAARSPRPDSFGATSLPHPQTPPPPAAPPDPPHQLPPPSK